MIKILCYIVTALLCCASCRVRTEDPDWLVAHRQAHVLKVLLAEYYEQRQSYPDKIEDVLSHDHMHLDTSMWEVVNNSAGYIVQSKKIFTRNGHKYKYKITTEFLVVEDGVADK